MFYLRTKLATEWPEAKPKWWEWFLRGLEANPNYRGKYHLVACWLVEFDENGDPWREIGLDARGEVVFAGPSASDYGFWLDTNMRREDFVGEPVTQEFFERAWAASGVTAP